MDRKLVRIAELALVGAVPEFCIRYTKPGRLRRLYIELETLITAELNRVTIVDDAEFNCIENAINDFTIKVGWTDKEKHVATLLSFCLAMLENSEFQYNYKILETLVNIFDYFERVGNTPAPCLWGGDNAALKWQEIMEKGD